MPGGERVDGGAATALYRGLVRAGAGRRGGRGGGDEPAIGLSPARAGGGAGRCGRGGCGLRRGVGRGDRSGGDRGAVAGARPGGQRGGRALFLRRAATWCAAAL